MKRLHEIDHLNSTTIANCLMLLPQGKVPSFTPFDVINTSSPSRVFSCKTCNRQFQSFQALGGHRASHKKPRLMGGDGLVDTQESSPSKPKTHECSICGLEFAIGQALGGHMRRHRAALNDKNQEVSGSPPSRSQEIRGPDVKRSSTRRVMLCLDLNLTPHENDLELFKLGKAAPMVDCYL